MSLKRFTSLNPSKDIHELAASLERPPTPRGARRSWFAMKPLSELEAEVLIYDFIGTGGVSADDFAQELSNIKASKITLRVNSEGGSVFDGIAIFNAIRRHRATVTAFVDGLAASAASFLIMAASEVVMSPHSQMIIHDAHGVCLGPAEEMRKLGEELDMASDNIAAIYARKTGGTVEEWRALMRVETWFTDKSAVEAGLADRVDGEDEEAVAARIATRVAARLPETNDDDPKPIDWGAHIKELAKKKEEAALAAR